jgi:pyruvate dehydrogenase E2 component (dihydrolipoamide acetyltransferase)
MATELRLPLLGDTMTEGRLVAWLRPDGATVQTGEPLYELETDKVSFTVESPAAGVLRCLAPEGEVLEVGALVGELTGDEAAPAAEAPKGGDVPATPAARRLARELGVDIEAVATRSPGRRTREEDVRAYHAAAPAPAPAPAPTPAADSVPYAGRRRAIGDRMLRSQQVAAALTLTSEVRADAALELIEGLNREWADDGVVLTLTRVVVRACALALREHPRLNARLEGDRIVLPGTVDVGLAVDDDEGLVVPVLRGADRRSLKDVARALRELTQRSEAGRLTQADVEQGTFTVTSLASTVVDGFTPIINPPQVAILGVGRVREIVAFEGSAVVPRRVTTLSLTFDHRVSDGAPAARFLGRVAELVQRPYLLMEPDAR